MFSHTERKKNGPHEIRMNPINRISTDAAGRRLKKQQDSKQRPISCTLAGWASGQH